MKKNESVIQIQTRIFEKTYSAFQLLNLTVLYYDFNYTLEDILKFYERYKSIDSKLDDESWCNKTIDAISVYTDKPLKELVKEFPYRSREKMMGGLPRGNSLVLSLANVRSLSAILSASLVILYIQIKDNNWGRNEINLWWNSIKVNSTNYIKGMNNEFIVKYLKDQLGLDILEY